MLAAPRCAQSRGASGESTPHTNTFNRNQKLMLLQPVVVLAWSRRAIPQREPPVIHVAPACVSAAVRRRGIKVQEGTLANLWAANGGERGIAAVRQYDDWIAKKLGTPAA